MLGIYDFDSGTESSVVLKQEDAGYYTSADAIRFVKQSPATNFLYDGDGNRVLKTEGGHTTLYINQYYEKSLTTEEETTHYYLGGRQIAYNRGGTLTYVHQDHLTGTSLTTGSTGTEKSKVKYFPFGDCRNSTGNVTTDKLFTGQRLDQTGLYFYNARYYDATIGRFISADPIVPDPFNPQSLNRYSYCLNNPLKYIDPSGYNYTESEKAASQVLLNLIQQAVDSGWDGSYMWYPSSPSDFIKAIEDVEGVYGDIDSDWGDMLDEDGVAWGSKVHLQTGSDYVTSFILEPTMECFAQLYGWSVYTTVQRDQGSIHTLRVYDSVTGERVGKAKLDDGRKTGDKLKATGQLFGGIVLATVGGVTTFVGGLTLPLGIGFAVGAGGGVLTAAGWALSRDAVHDLSAGQHGHEFTSRDIDDVAYGVFPTSYGPWGLTPDGWNGP